MPEYALRFVDITAVKEYAALFASLGPEEGLILCGGDGTLNRFINDTAGLKRPEALFYYACGSGNDFLRDAEKDPSQGPFLLTPYLRSLPQVQVKGAAHFFINGIGYGIDGYCCEKGDELRKKSTRPVNYTAIAIKGLLFHYHPTGARVTVDGNTLCFDHVWLAPVMLGRCYGGGMRPTPPTGSLCSGKDPVSDGVSLPGQAPGTGRLPFHLQGGACKIPEHGADPYGPPYPGGV